MDRSVFGNHTCEGYDAYFDGILRDECPYPVSDAIIEGMANPVTVNEFREDWCFGWDRAKEEQEEKEEKHDE